MVLGNIKTTTVNLIMEVPPPKKSSFWGCTARKWLLGNVRATTNINLLLEAVPLTKCNLWQSHSRKWDPGWGLNDNIWQQLSTYRRSESQKQCQWFIPASLVTSQLMQKRKAGKSDSSCRQRLEAKSGLQDRPNWYWYWFGDLNVWHCYLWTGRSTATFHCHLVSQCLNMVLEKPVSHLW